MGIHRWLGMFVGSAPSNQQVNVMRVSFRWLTALFLLAGALWQASILFNEWKTIPREDFQAWRIEYATINLEEKNQTELKLQARVEKRSEFKNVAIPHLEVILTDAADELVANKILKPQEWLPQDALRDNDLLLLGISPESEITTIVPMQIPENASGYRIRVFYP